jgi:hypothetical protein
MNPTMIQDPGSASKAAMLLQSVPASFGFGIRWSGVGNLLRLVLLSFVIALSGSVARAQDSGASGPYLPPAPAPGYEQVPPAPASQAPPASAPMLEPTPIAQPVPMVPPAPTQAGSALPSASFCSDGYWIASSWKCRQTAPHGCSCGDLEFYYRAGDGATQPLNREAFHASLTPGTPVLIVVHGSFTNWRGLCQDCGPVYQWIRNANPSRPLAVIFYTWPSSAPIMYEPHLDVAILGMRATFNSVYLGDLVARLPAGHPICIMGHSHGARMTAAALHLLAGGEVDDTHLTFLPPPEQRIRAVLVAGALDHHWMDPGQRYGMALCRTECLLYLRNDHDIVLSIYPMRRLFSRRALGESGLTRRDHERLGYLNSKVVQLDVTPIIRTGHMWNNYYVHPEIASAIAPFVYFDDGGPSYIPAPAPAIAPAGLESPPTVQQRRGLLTGLRSRFAKTTPAESRAVNED